MKKTFILLILAALLALVLAMILGGPLSEDNTQSTVDIDEVPEVSESVPTLESTDPVTGVVLLFPYPELQFTSHAAHKYENDENGRCLRKHYHTADGRALTIERDWIDEPFAEEGCGYNGTVANHPMTTSEIEKWERKFN